MQSIMINASNMFKYILVLYGDILGHAFQGNIWLISLKRFGNTAAVASEPGGACAVRHVFDPEVDACRVFSA